MCACVLRIIGEIGKSENLPTTHSRQYGMRKQKSAVGPVLSPPPPPYICHHCVFQFHFSSDRSSERDCHYSTVELDEDIRLLILKKINLWETKRKLLDTLVIDQLMSYFNDAKCIVFPTSRSIGNTNPYFYELIVLPLCDGSHFYGYIIDIKKKNINFVVPGEKRKEINRRDIKGLQFCCGRNVFFVLRATSPIRQS